jgi:hypothetical protein
MLKMKIGVDFTMKETICEFKEGRKEPELKLSGSILDEKEVVSKMVSEKGLSLSQAKIYLTLAKKGPLAFQSISEMLEIEKADVCRAILRLQKLGFVYVGEAPLRVYALRNHLIAH